MGGASYKSVKEGGGHSFNHMSFLQQLDAIEANNWTYINIRQSHQHLRSQVLMAHSTLNGTMSP